MEMVLAATLVGVAYSYGYARFGLKVDPAEVCLPVSCFSQEVFETPVIAGASQDQQERIVAREVKKTIYISCLQRAIEPFVDEDGVVAAVHFYERKNVLSNSPVRKRLPVFHSEYPVWDIIQRQSPFDEIIEIEREYVANGEQLGEKHKVSVALARASQVTESSEQGIGMVIPVIREELDEACPPVALERPAVPCGTGSELAVFAILPLSRCSRRTRTLCEESELRSNGVFYELVLCFFMLPFWNAYMAREFLRKLKTIWPIEMLNVLDGSSFGGDRNAIQDLA